MLKFVSRGDAGSSGTTSTYSADPHLGSASTSTDTVWPSSASTNTDLRYKAAAIVERLILHCIAKTKIIVKYSEDWTNYQAVESKPQCYILLFSTFYIFYNFLFMLMLIFTYIIDYRKYSIQ